MALATRLIGTLLVDGGTGMLVHRVGFKTVETRGYPVAQANVYASRSMDEILMLDVTATEQKREPDYDLISEVVGGTFLPVSYGGGITSVEQAVRIVSECGADKVVLRSRADLIGLIAGRLGVQAVVLAMDMRQIAPKEYEIIGQPPIGNPLKDDPPASPGEILLQSIDRDGTLSGYDLDLIRAVSPAVSIPVIASSGCGAPADMVAAMQAGASAVAAGWMWNSRDVTPADCKRALAAAGHTVRPVGMVA